MPPAPPTFHVVLHQPQIPNNTGNIGRTCIAVGAALHLIRPLGFDVSEKACRRAGLDYWPRLGVRIHDDWPSFLRAQSPASAWCFTTKGGRPLWDASLSLGDYLVFGRETAGLPDDILGEHPGRLLTLPMIPGERSLNLATAVCAAVYEGLRQCAAAGTIRVTADGRLVVG